MYPEFTDRPAEFAEPGFEVVAQQLQRRAAARLRDEQQSDQDFDGSPIDAAAPNQRTHPNALLALVMIVGGGLLTQLLSTVSGIISARMLGASGRGQVFLVASLALMASQLTLGGSLPNAITKMLAERGVTARDGLRRLLPKWWRWSVVPSAVAAGYLLFLQRDTSGATKYALAIGVLVMTVEAMMGRILVGALLGEGADLIQVAMTSVLPQAVTTIALAAAYGFGLHWNGPDVIAVTALTTAVVLAFRLRRLKPPTKLRTDMLDEQALRGLVRRTYIGSVGPIDGLSMDRTLVGSFMGNTQLGLYSAADALAGLTGILGGCLALVVLPRVTTAQQDPEREHALVRRWLIMSALLIGSIVGVLEVGTHAIIKLTFGEQFITATACAQWLLFASGLLDFRRVLIAVLQGRDHGGQASVIELGLTPFVVIGIVVAALRHSLVDVGITMAAVGLVSCLALSFVLLRSAPLHRYPARHRRAGAGGLK